MLAERASAIADPMSRAMTPKLPSDYEVYRWALRCVPDRDHEQEECDDTSRNGYDSEIPHPKMYLSQILSLVGIR